ncbi:MAG TPA: hypothetical protein VKB86_18685 [Pyrinomonadaceae bacterium]|nr:hypothetical protein [Pyrinomonadaceae bacterium]
MRKLKLSVAILCLAFTTTNASSAQVDQAFDEFSGFNCEDVQAHLDNFAVALRQNQNSQGYIIVYGGKYSWRGETQAMVNASRKYLEETRGIAKERFIIIDGGYREQTTMQLWMIPKGATAPAATPTVKRKDVRFKRGRARKNICNDE